MNIVLSKGHLNKVNVLNSPQDAIDFDFSEISIDNILVKNAGNDCLDVSSGEYSILLSNLDNCYDKAISVGEKSNFNADRINISNSNIGVAVKDSSKFLNDFMDLKNTKICFQIFQKKQEFGGGNVEAKDINCEGNNQVDKNSVIFYR